MLCAYMLLVKSFTCYWWWIVGVSMYWNIFGVDLWNYMKYVLLLSSPSSHTVGLVAFISVLVLNTYVFIIRGDMMFLLHQGRRPRRWKEIGTTRSWVGLDTLYVSRKSHVCYELGANTCWYICMLDECCSWNLMLVYSLMRMLCSCLFMQDIINDACLILLILYYDWCKTNP